MDDVIRSATWRDGDKQSPLERSYMAKSAFRLNKSGVGAVWRRNEREMTHNVITDWPRK